MSKTFYNTRATEIENKFAPAWLLYYLVLGVFQTLWTNQSAFPPMPLRLGMTLLVFGPLLLRKELIPLVFIFFITLRMYLSTDYSYLPDIYSIRIYLFILIGLSIFHYRVWESFDFRSPGVMAFMVFIFLWLLVDLLNGEIGKGTQFFIIAFLLLPFLQERRALEMVVGGYILVNLLLAIYYYVMYDKFVSTFSAAEGLERSGWADPNYFSIHIGIGFMMCMTCLFGHIKTSYLKFNRYLLIAGAFATFFAIMMTGSRAGLLSALGITILVVIFSDNKIQYKLLPLLVIPVVLYFVFKSRYAQLILYRLFLQGNMDTAGNRTTIWSVVFDNFFNQDVGHILLGGGWWHRLQITGGLDTHNEWIAVLCDYGIVGLTLLFVIYARIIMNKAYRGVALRLYVPFVYLLLMCVSLSPSQYPLMPLYIAWLIQSYRICGNELTVAPAYN